MNQYRNIILYSLALSQCAFGAPAPKKPNALLSGKERQEIIKILDKALKDNQQKQNWNFLWSPFEFDAQALEKARIAVAEEEKKAEEEKPVEEVKPVVKTVEFSDETILNKIGSAIKPSGYFLDSNGQYILCITGMKTLVVGSILQATLNGKVYTIKVSKITQDSFELELNNTHQTFKY